MDGGVDRSCRIRHHQKLKSNGLGSLYAPAPSPMPGIESEPHLETG